MGHGIWSMGTTTLFLHDPMVSHDPVILHNPMVLHNPLVLHEAFPCTFRPLGGKHISALHWSLMTSNICFWNPDVAVAKRSSARQKCTTSHFTASTSRGLPLPSPLVKTKLKLNYVGCLDLREKYSFNFSIVLLAHSNKILRHRSVASKCDSNSRSYAIPGAVGQYPVLEPL